LLYCHIQLGKLGGQVLDQLDVALSLSLSEDSCDAGALPHQRIDTRLADLRATERLAEHRANAAEPDLAHRVSHPANEIESAERWLRLLVDTIGCVSNRLPDRLA